MNQHTPSPVSPFSAWCIHHDLYCVLLVRSQSARGRFSIEEVNGAIDEFAEVYDRTSISLELGLGPAILLHVVLPDSERKQRLYPSLVWRDEVTQSDLVRILGTHGGPRLRSHHAHRRAGEAWVKSESHHSC